MVWIQTARMVTLSWVLTRFLALGWILLLLLQSCAFGQRFWEGLSLGISWPGGLESSLVLSAVLEPLFRSWQELLVLKRSDICGVSALALGPGAASVLPFPRCFTVSVLFKELRMK